MRAFLQEYGRSLLAVIVGSLSIGMSIFFLTKQICVNLNDGQKSVEHMSAAKERPVILAPRVVKIDKGDNRFDAKTYADKKESDEYKQVYQFYLKKVQAYENSERDTECGNLSVVGLEQIDVMQVGRYCLIYKAENHGGHTFAKNVNVFVR